MGGAAGCNDDFAAFVLLALNSILLICSLVGIAAVSYIWVMQADLVAGGEQALSGYVPEFILIAFLAVLLVVLAVALLGLIATSLQMKENKEGGGKTCAKIGSKDWCYSCGMTIYVFLCVFAFLFLLCVAFVAGIYSDKMAQFNSVSKVTDVSDAWIDTLETKMTTQVLKLADKYPKTWVRTQDTIGCCGWNANATGFVTAVTDGKCCKGTNVTNTVNIMGKFTLDYDGCRTDSDKKVYTCEGIVATQIKDNLVKTSITSALLAFLQLALGICGCVVRYPKLFPCCNCKKKNKSSTVGVESTQVKPVDRSGNSVRQSGGGGNI